VPGVVPALALTAAFSSACATVLIRRGLGGGSANAGFWINLAVGTVGLWVGVLLSGQGRRLTPAGLALFVLSGLIGTVGGRLLRFISIERVGASIAAALISLNPLVSSGLAILLLGERVTVPVLAGTVVIVLGTALLSAGGRREGLRPRLLVLPVLSAVCFGMVAILRKVGLSQTSAVMGSAINVSTALVAFSAFLLASGQRGTCSRRSLGYFVAAGVAENAAVFLNVVALGLGTVGIVAPLYGSAPIFVLVLSGLFLRDVEAPGARVVLGTLLIVAGVYCITAL
jgi:uncharacterized membrane protein